MAPINQSLDVSSPGVEGRGSCNFGQGGDLLTRKPPPPREGPRCGSPAAPSWSPWTAHRSTHHRRGPPAVTWKSQGEISTKALLRDHVWHNQGALKRPLWPFWDMWRKVALGELSFESIHCFLRTKPFLSSFYNLSAALGSSLFH